MNQKNTSTAGKIVMYFLNNKFSDKVERQVQAWLVEEVHDKEKEASIQEYWETLEVAPDKKVLDDFKRVLGKLKSGGQITGIKTTFKKAFTYKYYLNRIAMVLIPVFLLVGGYAIYDINKSTDQPITAYQKFDEVSVGSGESKQLTLPDGSKAVVGENSKLNFSVSEDGRNRVAHLVGKAQFSVKKNTEMPFVVETEHISITVLGTEFEVNAYPGSEIASIALTRGKVEIRVGEKLYSMEPGQLLEYNTVTGETVVRSMSEAKSEEIVSLDFAQSSLADILKAVETKYGIEIDADSRTLNSRDIYYVSFDEGEDITQVMGVLKDLVDGLSYRIEGDKIYVQKR